VLHPVGDALKRSLSELKHPPMLPTFASSHSDLRSGGRRWNSAPRFSAKQVV